jgi:GTP pyrophosphokinase
MIELLDNKLAKMYEEYEPKFNLLLDNVKSYSPNSDLEQLRKAFFFSLKAHQNQLRKSGEPYFEHCYQTAMILSELKMDITTICGGLLHDVVEDTGITIEEVKEKFGETVATLIDGVTKIGELKFNSVEEEQAENFRKMLLSMVKDIRVILIKFADRLHNMRTIEFLPEKKRNRIALETKDVYAPLAHRLGIAKIKWELEDLSLKVLDAKAYTELMSKVSAKREERESYIEKMTGPIKKELAKNGINAIIKGRPKNFYSIYNKMLKRAKPFEEIYDLFAIRILVEKVEHCYFALGIVHTVYTPVHERFKDYIATPKSNGYQSLHTTVIGPAGKMVEIQIRTHEMHRTAEEGIAAHWRYKEDKETEDELDKHLLWLRQLVDRQQEMSDPGEFLESLKIDLFQDEVFVFTPKGDLFKLPKGSTSVDFAFAIHSDIGFHCIGAKVNGKIVPLDTELKSGNVVEIITSANQKPHTDWLKFVKTSKARHHIRKWLKEVQFEQSVKLGEEIIEKNLKKLNLPKNDEEILNAAQSLNFKDTKQLYAALGRGEMTVQTVIRKIFPEAKEPEEKKNSFLSKFIKQASGSSGISIQGTTDNMMISFGKCCQPVPGDQIVGFVTKGKGLAIHRTDCKNALRLMQFPERHVEVKWDVEKDKKFLVRIKLVGEDRINFLRDVSQSIALSETNVISVNMKAKDHLAMGTLLVEVRNLQHLTKVINSINKVKGILSVERLDGAITKEEK